MFVECPSFFTAKKKVNNDLQSKLGMIDLNLVNQLIITSAATQPAPLQ